MAGLDDESGAGLTDEAGGALADEAGAAGTAPPAAAILDGAGNPVLDGAGGFILDGSAAAAGGGSGGGGGSSAGVVLDEAGFALEDEAGNVLYAESGDTSGGGTGGGGGGGGTGGGTAGTFPDAPLGLRAEIYRSGGWFNVTPWMDHGPVTIGRGHPDESTTVSPSTVGLTLTNSGARFSPDNVAGPYWPDLVQNIPLRVSVPAQSSYLRLEADSQDRAVAADNPNLDVSGSIDVQIGLRLTDWRACVLAAKQDGGGCWQWLLNDDGTMTFGWQVPGGFYLPVTSTMPVPSTSGDFALRARMDASGATVTFYTAPTVAGPWAQLGFSLTYGFATSIAVTTAPLIVGWSATEAGQQLRGRVYDFRLYNGVSGAGGVLAADARFGGQVPGVTSWTDAQGNTWQVQGGAELSGRDFRGHFEAAEWPQEEPPYNPDDPEAEVDALVQVAGGGLLRRYSQRSAPVQSAMYRAVAKQAGTLAPVAQWSMEDAQGSTRFGSASGGPAMTVNGTPSLASDSSFTASNPLPTLNGAVLCGQVAPYVSSGSAVTRLLAKVGTLPDIVHQPYATLLRVSTTGTIRSLYVLVYPDGGLGLIGYDALGNTVVNTGDVGWIPGGVSGVPLWYSAEVTPVSGGVKVNLVTVAPGATAGNQFPVTLSGAVVGNVTEVTINPNGFFTDTVAGHCSVQGDWGSLFDLGQALNGWQGEPAGIRFARLCAEEGIPCRTRGRLADTVRMGLQTPQTLASLQQQCADADQGLWYETRQVLGWGYVTRRALYNQAPAFGVSYGSDHLSPWASPPMRDDQFIVNDVTYSNAGGSTARAYAAPGQPVAGGRMSTLPPGKGGVGTYDQQYSVAVANDADLPNLAGWKLRLGTADQARLPGISLDLTGRELADQFYAILGADLGDRLTISDPPPRLGPDTVSQLAQQVTEELWHRTLSISVTGVPETPYQVARAGSAHAASGGTVIAAAAAAAATTLQFATAPGSALWSTSPGDYPLDVRVAGERITVTGMSGASSPQTAAVTRSVNGVAKDIAAGAAVGMFATAAVGL